MKSIVAYLKNPIKREIITLLIKHPNLKYSQLKLDESDNVLFNYHLQHLVKNEILDKNDSTYSLSKKGKNLTSNISHNGLIFKQFSPRLKMYILDLHKKSVLYQERRRSPWYGDTSALSTKLVWGEDLLTTATRRVKEKTNLDVQMTCIGTIRKMFQDIEGNCIDDNLNYICIAKDFNGNLKNLSSNKDPLIWLTFDEAKRKEHKNKSAGNYDLEIIKRLESNNFTPIFFEEIISI